jgi:CubicO group peptidase (beta-lactamase class C family)
MSEAPFADARAVIDRALASGGFPAASVEVGHHAAVLWRYAGGTLAPRADGSAPPATPDTIFDLASLTKVLATAVIVMQGVRSGSLDLDDPVARRIPRWRGEDREQVTLRDLLAHCSGLTAFLPFYRDHAGRAEFEPAICGLPLEYPPRTRSVYSDLGFMLLAWIAEDAGHAPLDVQFRRLCATLGIEGLGFRPGADARPRVAPAGLDPWRGRVLVGEVHDPNAWALGGVAGHAGLFGTAAAVGVLARHVLRGLRGLDTPLAPAALLHEFARRTTVPGSSRALGWDTMLPTSSCGTRMSPTAIGHTGFTGTSLWIDWERDAYVVLLTNRVHPSAGNDEILRVRPAFHDAVIDALDALRARP